MMSTCANLGKNEVFVLEGDPVTIGGNVYAERVVLTFVLTATTKLKQFRVKGSVKQVEAEVGNFGSNR